MWGMGLSGLRVLLETHSQSIKGVTKGSISPETKLFCYLSFLRAELLQWNVSRMCGLSQGSVCNIIEEMTNVTLS